MIPHLDWAAVDQVWVDFQIATMSESSLQPYGLLTNHWIGTQKGTISWIGPAPEQTPSIPHLEWIRGNGKLLTPGLIDCHTHCVYGGNRALEWERRLRGESYESIANQGGGILSTVQATRLASEDSLVQSAARRLANFVSEGVTTIEIKSGYGLDNDSERKMLRAAGRLGKEFGIDVQATLLAAHAVPPEFKGRSDAYVDWICHSLIPEAAELCSAVDVFCETIAFSVSQSTRVLQAALNHGLDIKAHAEQLSHLGFAKIAAEMGALSVDHIEHLLDSECEVLQRLGTVATLLPGAFYYLRETKKPPIETLVSLQVPIAVSTDCNPGSSPLVSVRTAANMACVLFGLTPEQAVEGVTRNAAKALGLQDRCGTIEVGKDADFAVWDLGSPAEICYSLGGNPCVSSFKRGKRIWSAEEGAAFANFPVFRSSSLKIAENS